MAGWYQSCDSDWVRRLNPASPVKTRSARTGDSDHSGGASAIAVEGGPGGLAMEANGRVARPRLVVDNRGEPLFKRSVAACRKRRLISVHREWNEHAEWWVGQVVANTEVYQTGSYVTPEQAFAATIAFYYEIVADVQREE